MKIKAIPYKMINHIQNYEWGTRGEQAFIPNILGIKAQDNIPYAELWIGGHPKLSSDILIKNNKIQLKDLIETNAEEVLGKFILNKFGNKIPFLLKILSANKALSIQTHPNKKKAIELHNVDSKNYPDNNHKPEIAIALDSLVALVGFRDLKKIEENINNYSVLSEFIGLDIVDKFKSQRSSEYLKLLFESLMNKANNVEELKNVIIALKTKFENTANLSDDQELFLSLYNQYGFDVGVLVLFFLNVVKLKDGEAIFTPAGIPHAYIKGNIVECMANSDNVVRAGLTPKFKDVSQLIDILTYQSGDVDLIGKSKSKHVVEYSVCVDEFLVQKIKLENESFNFVTNNSLEILLVVSGELICNDVKIKQGETVLLPALLNNISIEGNALLFRVGVPQ